MRWRSFRLCFLWAALTAVCRPQAVAAVDFRPDYVSAQAGGGMGIVSAGTGWRYGARQRFETELFVGLIPKYDSMSAKVTFAVKENFVPWRIRTGRRVEIEPLTASLYFTTVAYDKFWVRQPRRYPEGYYRLPTKVRTNISIGQRLVYVFPGCENRVKTLSIYYEIGTCDIYLLSAVGNSYLKPYDWLQLCLGLKIGI